MATGEKEERVRLPSAMYRETDGRADALVETMRATETEALRAALRKAQRLLGLLGRGDAAA